MKTWVSTICRELFGRDDRGRRPGGRPRRRLPLAVEQLGERIVPTAGALDPTFGVGGRVLTSFAIGVNEPVRDVAVQTDGKIVAAGDISTTRFAVARYLPDGSLDPSFGTGGKVETDVVLGSEIAFALAIQTDGKIVVAGDAHGAFGLVRYNADGSLDTGFGVGGKVVTEIISGVPAQARDVVIQSDGKIVVAGISGSSMLAYDFALARFNSDGTPDTTFGIAGKMLTDFGGGEFVNGVTLQNGKIVAAGATVEGVNTTKIALARYNDNGTLDTSFGTLGKVVTDLPFTPRDFASEVLAQSDGKIVIAGDTGSGLATNVVLVRYNADGSLDGSFGSSGLVVANIGGEDRGAAVVRQFNGKYVVGGYTDVGGYNFVLLRYNADGSPDTSFGTAGRVITDFGASNDVAYALALQSDGKIIAAGGGGPGSDFALARYEGDSPFRHLSSVFQRGSLVSVLGTESDDLVSITDRGNGVINVYSPRDGYGVDFAGVWQVMVRTGGGDDVVQYEVAESAPGGSLLAYKVHGGTGNDTLTARAVVNPATLVGFNPQPEPPAAVFSLDGGDGNDTISAQVVVNPATLAGFNPQPEPSAVVVAIDGGAGDDRMTAQGIINPVVLAGFNPQPEPPALLLALTGSAGNDTMSSQAIVNPVVLVGFNPQPEPPAVSVGVMMSGGDGDDVLTSEAFLPPGSREGFNPQPEPPETITANLTGGAGRDVLTYRAQGQLKGSLAIGMDGGADNDAFDASFGLSVGSRGRVSAMLAGGLGDDVLSFNQPEPVDGISLWGLIDGGDGFDLARYPRGVQVVNVEG